MAVDTQKLVILLQAKGVKLTKNELKSLNKTVKGTGSALGGMTGKLLAAGGAFFAAQGIIAGISKSVSLAAKFEGVSRGFDNLAKSAGLSSNAFQKLKQATDGTVSSVDLMKQANNAMLLGIVESEDQMADMFDIAQRLGSALGLDTLQAVESLTTGIGRQSKLMLDNLGIMIDTNKAYSDYAESIHKSTDALTDAEKKTAFINATMKEANTLVEKLGEEELTLQDSLNQAKGAFSDIATEMGSFFAPAIARAAKETRALADAMTGVAARSQQHLNNMMAEGAKTLHEKEVALESTKRLIEEQVGPVKSLNEALKVARDLGISQNSEFTTLIENYKMLKDEIKHLKVEVEGDSELKAEYIAQSGALTIKTIELRKSTQEWVDTLKKVPTTTGVVRKELSGMEVQLIKLNKLWDAQALVSKKSADAVALSAMKQGAGYKNAGLAAQDAAANVVIAEAQKIVSSYLASIFASVPFPFNLALAAGASSAAGSLMQGAIGEMSKIKLAADGMDEIVTQPTPIIAGEAGPEQVTITPLGDVGDAPSGGGGITVNLSGNILTQDFVEGELAEAISEAVRRGNDFGIA